PAFDAESINDVGQQIQKLPVVDLVNEDLHASVTTRHHVPQQSDGLDAPASSHPRTTFISCAVRIVGQSGYSGWRGAESTNGGMCRSHGDIAESARQRRLL